MRKAMRHYRLITAIAAIAAAVSCATIEEIDPAERRMLVEGSNPTRTFTASLGVATKTIYNEDKSVSWATGDVLKVFDAAGASETFTVEEDCDDFSFTSDGTLGEGPYYAIAGYGDATPTFEEGIISVARPAATTDGSFASADLIASTTDGQVFTFHHALAILKMSIAADDITSITLEADGIAGDLTMIGFGTNGALDVVCDDSGDSVTIEGITDAGTYYMAVNPGTYEDGFTFYLNTETKTTKVSSDKSFTATAGKVLNFGTLDELTRTDPVVKWTLVTAASDLSIGDEIIIATADGDIALSTTQNKNNRGVADITKSSDGTELTTNPGDDVQIFTIEEGYSTGSYAFSTGSQYIYCASSGSGNYLRTQNAIDANASWTISISSTGETTIRSKSSSTRNKLMYNENNNLFSCYSGGQKDVVIFKNSTIPGSGPSIEEVSALTEETVWGVYDYDADTDELTPVYQYDIRNDEPASGSDQYAVSGAGNVSFRIQSLSDGLLAGITLPTAAPGSGSTYTASVLAYGISNLYTGISSISVTVVKVTDDTVWLQEVDGTTAFIIPIN